MFWQKLPGTEKADSDPFKSLYTCTKYLFHEWMDKEKNRQPKSLH